MADNMWVAYSWMAVSLGALSGFWLYLHYRRADRALGSREEVARLEATVQELQAELGGVANELHDRLEQLHERVDFTERLLAERPAAPKALPGHRIPTPV